MITDDAFKEEVERGVGTPEYHEYSNDHLMNAIVYLKTTIGEYYFRAQYEETEDQRLGYEISLSILKIHLEDACSIADFRGLTWWRDL